MAQPISEAARIYRAIFGRAIPPALEQHYLAVPARVCPASDTQWENYQRILADVDDLEALELASRWRQRNRLLTARFALMIHLAECYGDQRGFFVAPRDQPTGATLALIARGLAGWIWKATKGLMLLRRYDGP